MGQLYATLADLANLGVVSTAFGQLTNPQVQAQLQAASDFASSKMAARYSLPLTAWDTSITQAVAQIAAYQCMCLRGFDPQNGGDQRGPRLVDRCARVLRCVSSGNTRTRKSRNRRSRLSRRSRASQRRWCSVNRSSGGCRDKAPYSRRRARSAPFRPPATRAGSVATSGRIRAGPTAADNLRPGCSDDPRRSRHRHEVRSPRASGAVARPRPSRSRRSATSSRPSSASSTGPRSTRTVSRGRRSSRRRSSARAATRGSSSAPT